MLVLMSKKIFDLLFTLPHGATSIGTHVYLQGCWVAKANVAKANPSLPGNAAIVRVASHQVRSTCACCPTPITSLRTLIVLQRDRINSSQKSAWFSGCPPASVVRQHSAIGGQRVPVRRGSHAGAAAVRGRRCFRSLNGVPRPCSGSPRSALRPCRPSGG